MGPPIHDGMAGSKRLKNLWNELNKHDDINLISYSSKNNNIKDIRFISSYAYLLYQLVNNIFSNKIYIYHYGYINILTFPLIAFSKFFGVKLVLDIVEDIHIKTEFSSNLNKIKYQFTKLFYKSNAFLCNGIIVISSYLESKVKKDFPSTPLELLPISIDKNIFENQLINQNNNLQLFYGGSFASKDGIEDILKSFQDIREKKYNCKLILTGKIDRKRKTIITSLLKKHPFKEDIKYLGFLPDEEYYNILNSCDLHLMYRNSSNFARSGYPFKLGEMLATGRPVIVSNLEGISDILYNHENCVLIEPENSFELSSQIEFLLNNKDERIRIGKNGKKTAFTYFDSTNVKDIFLKFIKSI